MTMLAVLIQVMGSALLVSGWYGFFFGLIFGRAGYRSAKAA
jgi:hypothetical protein